MSSSDAKATEKVKAGCVKKAEDAATAPGIALKKARGSDLGLQVAAETRQVPFQIAQILANDPVNLTVVHARVEVDQQVPEPRHSHQSRAEVVVDHADLRHDRHAIGIVFRAPRAAPGGQVIADIERRLGRDDQKVLRAVGRPWIRHEQLRRRLAELAQLAYGVPHVPGQLAESVEVYLTH